MPPKLLIRLGLVKEGEMWLVERALYGLRESPKLWVDYRDIEISQMGFELEGTHVLSSIRALRKKTCG